MFPSNRSNIVGVSCNNRAVARLLNPYFSQSGFQIYADRGWSGKTKMDWRIGGQRIPEINFRQPPSRTVVLGPNQSINLPRFSPLDIRVKVQSRIQHNGIGNGYSGGLKLTIPFSSSPLLRRRCCRTVAGEMVPVQTSPEQPQNQRQSHLQSRPHPVQDHGSLHIGHL